jgi:hypothetical protein
VTNFVSGFFRFALKLVLAAFGLVFVVSLLAAALIVLAFSLLKSLITGKKTAPAMVFGRFQKFSPEGMWPGASRREGRDGNSGKSGTASDVVDVEVREIKSDVDKRLP